MKCRYADILIIAANLFLILLLTAPVMAEGENPFDTVTVYWENDTFVGTDADYTNGFKLTLSTPYKTGQDRSRLPYWSKPIINLLPFVNDPSTPRAVSVSIGQDIYTPEDTDSRELIEDERPYAGITYLSTGYHSKANGRKNSWELIIGIVGRHSYAEDIQNWVHGVIDSKRARGWDNQLKDEPLFEAVYESQWRLYRSDRGKGFGYDVIPHLGGRVGNINIYANAGAEIRFGWGLSDNYGTCPIRAGCETDSASDYTETGFPVDDLSGFHFFLAADGRFVLWDITLDGNAFRDSHSVEKENIVADIMAGIAMEYSRIKVSYSYIYRTKQFTAQDRNQIFGAVRVSYSY
ncbi:MAG: lipid A deacylase LpxR family protein [Nitrospiraceae bacterium]|nr:MAG: lipid A deacylase LpxR family protein [Nitrospiraceae bacterium]